MRTYCRLLGPDHRGRHKACVYSDHRTPTANAICGSRARADSTHGATGQRLSRFVLVRDPRHAHQSHPDAALIIVMATGAKNVTAHEGAYDDAPGGHWNVEATVDWPPPSGIAHYAPICLSLSTQYA